MTKKSQIEEDVKVLEYFSDYYLEVHRKRGPIKSDLKLVIEYFESVGGVSVYSAALIKSFCAKKLVYMDGLGLRKPKREDIEAFVKKFRAPRL